jgi:Fe-S cluster assembly ATP-binding protein
MDTEERARAGLFLAFQYPVEIPGVSNMEFLKAAVDAVREHRGEPAVDAVSFMKRAREACKAANLPAEFLKRGVNEGFSGGEKKRNELIQMLLLEPRLCILDETDSGLDIDALQVVAEGVNSLRIRSAPSCSSRTTSACSTTSSRIAYTCFPRGASCAPATRTWP